MARCANDEPGLAIVNGQEVACHLYAPDAGR